MAMLVPPPRNNIDFNSVQWQDFFWRLFKQLQNATKVEPSSTPSVLVTLGDSSHLDGINETDMPYHMGYSNNQPLSTPFSVSKNLYGGNGPGGDGFLISNYLSAGSSAIWPSSVTPTTTNYTVFTSGGSFSYLNGTVTAELRVGGTQIVEATSSGAVVQGTLQVNGTESVTGALTCSSGFGANGASAQGKYAGGGSVTLTEASSSPGPCYGAAAAGELTALTNLVNKIYTALQNNGIMS